MPVFFLPPGHITPPSVSIKGDLLTHLRDSLRLEVGNTVLVSENEIHRYRVEITDISRQSMTGRVLEIITGPPPHAPSLILGQALLKGPKMDWIVQKATELGVRTIIPIQSQHCTVHLKADRIETQTARWRRIALEAAQQSEQWRIPAIATPCSFHAMTRQVSDFSLTLMLTERHAQVCSLADAPLLSSTTASILVLIGPEGGWAQKEIVTTEKAGGILITLGSKILRAETAALTTIGILQHRLGELR